MLARIAMVLALVGVASVTMVGFTSFTSFDPADWVRIASMAPLPFVFLGSVASAFAVLRSGVGRSTAIAAMVLDAAVLISFVVMIVVGG